MPKEKFIHDYNKLIDREIHDEHALNEFDQLTLFNYTNDKNFQQLDLSGFNFKRCNFSEINFSETTFARSTLNTINFRIATLKDVNFNSSCIINSDFTNAIGLELNQLVKAGKLICSKAEDKRNNGILYSAFLAKQTEQWNTGKQLSTEVLEQETKSVNNVLKKLLVTFKKITSANSRSKDIINSYPNKEEITMKASIILTLDKLVTQKNINQLIIGNDWHGIPLIKAIRENKIAEWRSLIETLTGLNLCDENGNTGLHIAALENKEEVIHAFIAKAQVHNEKNYFGLTPLHMAVLKGRADVVRHLLESAASAKETCEFKWPLTNITVTASALTLAILIGREDEDIVKTIYTVLKIKHKLDDDKLTTCSFGNVLHAAIISHSGYMLRILLTDPEMQKWAKKYFNKTNIDGETPLAYAAKLGHLEAIEWLIEAGANVNATNNNNGRTALHYAVIGKQPNAVYRIIELQANVNLMSEEDIDGNIVKKNPLNLAQMLLTTISSEINNIKQQIETNNNNAHIKQKLKHLQEDQSSVKTIIINLENEQKTHQYTFQYRPLKNQCFLKFGQ